MPAFSACFWMFWLRQVLKCHLMDSAPSKSEISEIEGEIPTLILQGIYFHKRTAHLKLTCMWSVLVWRNCVHIFHCRSDSTTEPTTLSATTSSYLMFELALLLLFALCRFCLNRTSDVKKKVLGSFLRVTQNCSHCKRKWVWDSQSLIGDIHSCWKHSHISRIWTAFKWQVSQWGEAATFWMVMCASIEESLPWWKDGIVYGIV